MRKIRTYHEAESDVGSDVLQQVLSQRRRLSERLASVRTIVAVASGKGGVGKSVVVANLAVALAGRGRTVGVVDADLNGPSSARNLGVSDRALIDTEEGIRPATGVAGVKVFSMEFLQGADDAPLRWKEPDGGGFVWQSSLETGALREFLSDVAWGELDYLLIDLPPGVDKLQRVLGLLPDLDQVLLVTIPSDSVRHVTSRAVRLVRESDVGRMGIVANMTEHVCPDCGHRSQPFGSGWTVQAHLESESDLWGKIPFHPRFGTGGDHESPLVVREPGCTAAKALQELADRVEAARAVAETENAGEPEDPS